MTDILVPFEQEGTKAIVRSWLKKVGDMVAVDDPLVELETDKVTQEVPAPGAGILLEILLDTDDEALPGAILGRLGDATSDAPATASSNGDVADRDAAATDPRQDAPLDASAGIKVTGLSPAVRRALLENAIDPKSIAGTGRAGRLTREDVDRAVVERDAARNSSARDPELNLHRPEEPSPVRTSPSPPREMKGRFVPHDRMRLAIAENMLNSVTTAPHVTAVFECDFSAIIAHRRRNKPAFERDGANLTYTAYVIAACVAAMRVAPAINGRWHPDGTEYFDDVSIGVGTALGDRGLIVPVVARAQELSLLGIATRLTDLIGRARENRLAPADVRGGTFTVSNHGVSGSLIATPIIIAQPQSAILGVGKLEKRVIVREVDGMDTIQIRPLCYVSLTIDHRVVDGHQTNGWLTKFVETLEQWPLDG